MSILLLLMIGAWLGYREIGVSFLGIHIRDLMSTRVIGIMQFLVVAALCLLAIFINDETSSKVNNLYINEAYIIMCGIVLAVAIVRSADQYTSAVTAFWGALAAVAYNDQWLNNYPLIAALLSIIAAPLLGLLFFSVYDRLFDRIIFKSDKHLLLKNLYMKRLALVGIILGGLTLAINYALFSSPFLSSFLTQIDVTWLPFLFLFMAILSMAMVIPMTAVLRNENSMAKPMSWALPSLYALITVLLLGNIAGTLLLGMVPVIVSPSQLRECSKMTKGARQRSLINLASITIATPLIAFLIAMAMMRIVVSPLLIAIVTCFVLITCLLIIMYSKQWRKQRHTATRVYVRLRDEEHYEGSYSTVQRYVRWKREQMALERDQRDASGYLLLRWLPGECQVDFGEADFRVRGVTIRGKYLTVSFPHSNVGFTQVFWGETSECVCQGLRNVFEFVGGVPERAVFDNATEVGRRFGAEIRVGGSVGKVGVKASS